VSWFVQVTVDPVLTVSMAGLKAKFFIMTAFDPPAGAGVAGVIVAGLWGEVQPAHVQDRNSMITDTKQKMIRESKVIFFLIAVLDKKCSCSL
jgi:hypothetical protein